MGKWGEMPSVLPVPLTETAGGVVQVFLSGGTPDEAEQAKSVLRRATQ